MEKRDFTNRDLYNLIVPIIISLALQLIVGMIDSIMVASVSEEAVSGVSLVDSLMQFIIYIFSALATGGAVVAGQYLGAKNIKKANQASEELLWLNVGISIIITIVMLLTSNWILHTVFGDITDVVLHYASRYFYVVICSIPFIAIFEASTSIFRTMRDSSTTMKVSLFMNVLNGIGNAILIYGFHLDTAGAAISTLFSRIVASILCMFLLQKSKKEIRLKVSLKHKFDFSMWKNIMYMGVPGGIENGIFQLGKIVILSLVTTFGTYAISANAITQTMAGIQMIPASAIQLATIPVIAHCIGTKDFQQVQYYNRKLLRISYITLAIWTIILAMCLPFVIFLYHVSDTTATLVYALCVIHAVGGITLWPTAFNLPAALRACGDVKFPMYISIFSMWTFRYGGAYIFANTFQFGVVGVWFAMAFLDWGFRSICFIYRWKKGKWKQKALAI